MKSATYTLGEIIALTGLEFTNPAHLDWLDSPITGIWNPTEALSSEITFMVHPGRTRAKFVITLDPDFVEASTAATVTHILVHPAPRYAASLIAALWETPSSFRELMGHPRATVYDCVLVGENIVLGPNVVLGGQGFGFERHQDTGEYFKFPHLGGVVIGNDVEIQSHSNVDRGVLTHTRIGNGTKVDSFVHVGHNAQIGQNVMITAGVIVGGSVTIEDNVWVGLNSTIMQGVTIGKGATIGIGTTVLKNVLPGETVVGTHRVIESKSFQRGVIR